MTSPKNATQNQTLPNIRQSWVNLVAQSRAHFVAQSVAQCVPQIEARTGLRSTVKTPSITAVAISPVQKVVTYQRAKHCNRSKAGDKIKQASASCCNPFVAFKDTILECERLTQV